MTCCTFVYSVINLIWNKQYVFFIISLFLPSIFLFFLFCSFSLFFLSLFLISILLGLFCLFPTFSVCLSFLCVWLFPVLCLFSVLFSLFEFSFSFYFICVFFLFPLFKCFFLFLSFIVTLLSMSLRPYLSAESLSGFKTSFGNFQGKNSSTSGMDTGNCFSQLMTCLEEVVHFVKEKTSISW